MSQDNTEHSLVESLSPSPKAGRRVSLPLIFSLLAVLLAGGALAYQVKVIQNLQATVNGQDAQTKKQQLELQGLQRTLAGRQQAAEARLTQVEAKQSETLDQQEALTSMYDALTRNEVQRGLAETEQLLVFASQQLQLTGQPGAALSILSAVDQRLAQINRPDYINLRRALAKDIETLKALPQVDMVGVAAKLDSLSASVDRLPLLVDDTRLPDQPAPPAAKDASWLARISGEIWHEMKQLVEIQRIDNPDAILLSPDQTWFLRENLKLRFLNARSALLARDDGAFHADIAAADRSLSRYFDQKTQQTIYALQTLRQINKTQLALRLPDLAGSLTEVRMARQLSQRGAQ